MTLLSFREICPERMASLWPHRDLLQSLVARNLKVKYQRSILGFVWTLLYPLLMLAVLIAIFTYVIRIPLQNYWAFLISGFFIWNFMQQSLNVSAFVLAQHANMIRSVKFPTEILILGAIIARLIEFSAEIALVMVVLVLVHHQGIPASFAILPLLIVLQFMLGVALVLPIAVLAVFYQDIQHALPLALTTLFYVSPVFYPVEMIPESFRLIYLVNPIAQLLTLYHAVLYEGTFPSLTLLGITTTVALLGTAISYAIFRRFRHVLPEVV